MLSSLGFSLSKKARRKRAGEAEAKDLRAGHETRPRKGLGNGRHYPESKVLKNKPADEPGDDAHQENDNQRQAERLDGAHVGSFADC